MGFGYLQILNMLQSEDQNQLSKSKLSLKELKSHFRIGTNVTEASQKA